MEYTAFVEVKVKFTLEQATKARVEVQLYSSFNRGTRYGWVVNATLRPLNPRERPGAHCTGG